MNMNLLMTGIFLTASSFAWSANKVDNVVVTESEDGNSAVVVIESKEPLKYTLNQTEEPPLAEIYLEQDVSCEEEPFQQAGKKLIKEIKLTCQRSKSKSQGEPAELLRSITLVLDQKCSISFSQKDWILSLTFQRETSKVGRPVGIGEVLPLGAATPAGIGGTLGGIGTVDLFEPPRMTLSSRPGLDEFVQVGLANHRPLEIAQSELKLARRKHFESKRNFFPVLSGRGTQTEGTTQSDPNDPATRADFNRKEIGLEIGQPLFQSGRLYYSEKQAGVQKEISEWQISKLTLEVQFEVTKSLYAYLSAKENLAIRKELVSQSEKILDTTSKKKEIGVASESEYLGVLSSNNQIAYKAVSQEKDMEIAKSRLMGVLNVDLIPDDAPIEIEPIVTRAQGLGLDLNRLVALAMTNRPEIKTSQLTRLLKEYARKVSRAENLFKLDASGFIGQSGAAFKKESLTMKDSYNLAVKSMLYFGGSSVGPMASTEKTAPDLGSASRTETRAQSVTVGILDSLQAGSTLMQSKIDEEKAKEDFRKVRKDILLEVKESFFNYQKARLQIEAAKKEVEYRKKEVAIAQTKDKLHQIEAPQFLQAIASLKESEISLKEAMTFFVTSVSAMEKACGTKLTQ